MRLSIQPRTALVSPQNLTWQQLVIDYSCVLVPCDATSRQSFHALATGNTGRDVNSRVVCTSTSGSSTNLQRKTEVRLQCWDNQIHREQWGQVLKYKISISQLQNLGKHHDSLHKFLKYTKQPQLAIKMHSIQNWAIVWMRLLLGKQD